MIVSSWSAAMDYVQKKFPNAKSVPVAAWNIAYALYENDTYETEIGEILYEYPGNGMFGYDYNVKLNKQ